MFNYSFKHYVWKEWSTTFTICTIVTPETSSGWALLRLMSLEAYCTQWWAADASAQVFFSWFSLYHISNENNRTITRKIPKLCEAGSDETALKQVSVCVGTWWSEDLDDPEAGCSPLGIFDIVFEKIQNQQHSSSLFCLHTNTTVCTNTDTHTFMNV